jgi:hypothetical protein
MALPELQNESSMLVAKEAIQMDNRLANIDGGIEVVWETLDRLVEINTASLDTLRNMLEVDLEGIEAARSQAAFDEEAAADAAAQTEITDKETRKSIMQMASDNAGLLLGVTAAVTGLMAMKDWIAEGFKNAVEDIKGALRAPGEIPTQADVTSVRRNVQAATAQTLQTAETVAETLESPDSTTADKKRDGIAFAQARILESIRKEERKEVEYRTLAPENRPQLEVAYKDGKGPEPAKYSVPNDVKKIMEKTGVTLADVITPEIQQLVNIDVAPAAPATPIAPKTEIAPKPPIEIDDGEYDTETDMGDASYLSSTLEQDSERSVPTPMNTIIDQAEAAPAIPEGNYGIADSPEMKQFEKSQVGVNPSASEPITIYIGGQSKDTASGGVVVNNNNIDNSTKVIGGGSSAPSTGQAVTSPTRENKSPQDDVRNRAK